MKRFNFISEKIKMRNSGKRIEIRYDYGGIMMLDLLIIISMVLIIIFLIKQTQQAIKLLEKINDEYYQKGSELIKSNFELEKENIELKYKLDIESNKSELYKIELDKMIELKENIND